MEKPIQQVEIGDAVLVTDKITGERYTGIVQYIDREIPGFEEYAYIIANDPTLNIIPIPEIGMYISIMLEINTESGICIIE